MTNKNLQHAKVAKNDEFYTMLSDIENELQHYTEQFKGKVVYCNCDDPEWSNFWKYFHENFEKLHLKRLISTHYESGSMSYKMEYEGGNDNDIECGVKTPLDCDGDFRSAECVEILDEADIVVTNPPFSLFRSYIGLMVERKKKFLVIGSQNAITCKEIFPLIKNSQLLSGYNHVKKFISTDGSIKQFGNIQWFTNLDTQKRHENIQLTKKYNPADYQHYDNYDAINVDRVKYIPCDYCESWEVTSAELEFLPADAWQVVRKGFRDDVETFFIIPAEHTELRAALHEHAPGYREKIEAEIEKTLKKKRDIAAESSVCRLHSSTDTIRSSSKLSDTSTTCQETEASAFPVDNSKHADEACIKEFSLKRYCNGIVGVPITFMDKFNPEQFRIIWQASGNTKACCPDKILTEILRYSQHPEDRGGCGVIHNMSMYGRILIQQIV